jgi:DNA-binding XRE family transcriptional regulator
MVQEKREKKAAVTKLPEQEKQAGRPSAYKPEYCEQTIKLCRLGSTDKDLADFFGVDEKTINSWKKEHPEFLQSIKKGKEFSDAEVADRLFKRATGYEHPEDKIFLHDGEPVVVSTIKHYPPDPISAIFWLKNRQRKRWRDKPLETDADEKLKFRVGYGGEYD